MVLKIQTPYSALLRTRSAALFVIFIALMALLAALSYILLYDASGVWHTLYTIALGIPAVGILLTIFSVFGAFRRYRTPVCTIGETVAITETGVNFPAADLALVEIFSKGRTSFASLIPQHVVGHDQHYPEYTFTFPAQPNIKPTQLADHFRDTRPDVRVVWKGSI